MQKSNTPEEDDVMTLTLLTFLGLTWTALTGAFNVAKTVYTFSRRGVTGSTSLLRRHGRYTPMGSRRARELYKETPRKEDKSSMLSLPPYMVGATP